MSYWEQYGNKRGKKGLKDFAKFGTLHFAQKVKAFTLVEHKNKTKNLRLVSLVQNKLN
jgi:hypothetical protein